LLIGYADAAEHAREARRFGFETTVRTPDPDAILRDTFDFTNKYDGTLENALGTSVTLYRGQPTFGANRTLRWQGKALCGSEICAASRIIFTPASCISQKGEDPGQARPGSV